MLSRDDLLSRDENTVYYTPFNVGKWKLLPPLFQTSQLCVAHSSVVLGAQNASRGFVNVPLLPFFCMRFNKNFNVKNGSRSWRETRVPCSLETDKFAAANIPRFWLLYASSPSRTRSRSRSLSKGFNIQGKARMNIHERIGDCTVILINCTLNPVEMDH